MTAYRIAVSGVIGLVMGSFLTVVTHRVPAGLSIVRPGSQCPSCATPLRGLDNIPVVSFVLRRRRCRHCKSVIAWRYLLLEIGTGATFALVGWRISSPAVLPAFLVLTVGLVAATVIDLEHRRIPTPVVYATAAAGAPLLVVASAVTHRWSALATAGGAGAVAFLLFFAIFMVAPRSIGFGDVRFAPLCCAFLGWLGVRIAAVGLTTGMVLAGLTGVGLLLSGAAGRKSAIPLGPFLAAGTFVALLFGADIAAVWLR